MAHLSRVAWLCLFLLVCVSAIGRTPERIRREEWDQANKLVTKVDPVYPPPAKQAGIQGMVLFDAVIGKDGRVMSVALISGDPLLVDAARQAVMKWVYKPTVGPALNFEPAEPVEVEVPIRVVFDSALGARQTEAPTEPDPRGVAQQLSQTILAKCGDSYYYRFDDGDLMRLKDVSSDIVPESLSQADHANGMRWRGVRSGWLGIGETLEPPSAGAFYDPEFGHKPACSAIPPDQP